METVRPVTAGAMVWRSGSRVSVSIAVKATFSFVEEGLAELIAPAPLALEERYAREGGPSSLIEDLDLVPYKSQVDVTFVGSVHAAHPVQAIRARLAIVGPQDGIDKSIQAVGDRVGPGSPPRPFRQLALGWERTWGSPDNPIGVPPGGIYQASLVDPQRPGASVGLGPIPRAWGGRARLLGNFDPRGLRGPTPELPQGFPWEYYQSAPRDQRLGRLTGGETVMLENLLEGRPRLRTRLPSARARARLYAAWTGNEGQDVELVADTLALDGDVQTASIVWRASVPLPHGETSLQGARLVAGVEMPGFPMPWPGATGSGTYPRSPAIAAYVAAPAGGPLRESGSGMQAVHRDSSSALPTAPAGLPRAYDDEGAEGTAMLDVEGASPGARLLTPGRAAPSPPAGLAPPSAPGTGTMALTPEDATRLLKSAPRHMPFPGEGSQGFGPGGFGPPGFAAPPAPPPPAPPPPAPPPPVQGGRDLGMTMRSPGAQGQGYDLPPADSATRPHLVGVAMAGAAAGSPAPPPAAPGPPEEKTRQMALGAILDETTSSLASSRSEMSRPSSAVTPPPASAPASASTMALTPEQASAMLAHAGRRPATPGGFPPPGPPPPLPDPAPRAPAPMPPAPMPMPPSPVRPAPVAPGMVPPAMVPVHVGPPPKDLTLPSPGMVPRAPPPPDDDLDTSAATFALTPEEAMRMMEEAARKKPR